MASLQCSVLSGFDALSKLDTAWQGIWDADLDATVFQSFDWCLTWAKNYAECISELYVVICYEGESAVCVAPFYVPRDRGIIGNLLSTRKLMFFGTGEPEADESFAEYMAPITMPGYELRCARRIAKQINCDRRIKGIEFHRVRRHKLNALVSALEIEWNKRAQIFCSGRCYHMPANSDAALGRLSSKSRASLKRKMRKIRGSSGFELRVADGNDSFSTLFDALILLHQERWNAVGKTGVFRNDRFSKFHKELAGLLLNKDALLLCGIFIDGLPLAVNYSFLSRRKCLYYQGGVALNSTLSNLSPGILLHFFAAEIAGMRGASQYDLMMSTEVDYKARISVSEEALHTISISRYPAFVPKRLLNTQ